MIAVNGEAGFPDYVAELIDIGGFHWAFYRVFGVFRGPFEK
jgi:hypothetical protein